MITILKTKQGRYEIIGYEAVHTTKGSYLRFMTNCTPIEPLQLVGDKESVDIAKTLCDEAVDNGDTIDMSSLQTKVIQTIKANIAKAKAKKDMRTRASESVCNPGCSNRLARTSEHTITMSQPTGQSIPRLHTAKQRDLSTALLSAMCDKPSTEVPSGFYVVFQ